MNFNKKFKDLELRTNDDDRVTFSIPLSKSTAFGSFKGTVTTFYLNVVESDSETVDIVIEKCETQPATTVTVPQTSSFGSTSTTTAVVAPPPFVAEDELIIIPPKGQEKNASLSTSPLTTGLLVVGNLLALSVLGVMGYGVFRKKPEVEEVEAQPVEQFTVEQEYY